MTPKDRIHSEWCLCTACRPRAPGERAGPLTMVLVYGTSVLVATATLGLAILALQSLL